MKTEKGIGRNNVEILLVEDSPTQAEQLKHLLEGRGYTVTLAGNGKQALGAARKRKPTLVVTDVVMPEMDGYTLCKEIKFDRELKDTPVVLVTSLSSPQDVLKGLECGADNFITKPYEEKYLLSRIEYILANQALRAKEKVQLGLTISLGGRKQLISAERQQILDLLISTYEEAVHINEALQARQKELERSQQSLTALYRLADGLNRTTTLQEVADAAFRLALELPGVGAGWLLLREGESGVRTVAGCNLPPALEATGALEGDCLCRRKLLAGELDEVCNILECERLQKAKGDTRGFRFHASVPLWVGKRTIGVLNLVGTEQGLFRDEELEVLRGMGYQVAVALQRAQLAGQLEAKVKELTAANKEAELHRREAERASQFKSQFLASMSHELRTPLNAIIGFSDLLAEQTAGPLNEKQKRFTDYIRDGGHHLLALINDILDLSRIEAGKLELHPEDFAAAQALPEVLSTINHWAMKKKIEVSADVPPDLGVRADRVRFKQILFNLLSNAVKFTPEGGRIR
ncbi:MAG: response regulator, partial [Acidobacteria bacterium]|nr:response regulator [Acidobacteriota bacterium]